MGTTCQVSPAGTSIVVRDGVASESSPQFLRNREICLYLPQLMVRYLSNSNRSSTGELWRALTVIWRGSVGSSCLMTNPLKGNHDAWLPNGTDGGFDAVRSNSMLSKPNSMAAGHPDRSANGRVSRPTGAGALYR